MRVRAVGALLVTAVGSMLAGLLVGAFVVAPALDTTGHSVASTPPPTASPSPIALATPSPTPVPTPKPSPKPTFPPSAPGQVPVLYYHRVEPEPAGFATWATDQRQTFMAYNVLPNAFEAQLDWLQANGYRTILPRDLAAHWDKGKKLPARPVILTFDDGSPDWVSVVVPALQRHHMVAEFYVVIDNIGQGVTWDDVKAMAKAGMGIGAHDVHHVQLTGFGGNGLPASWQTMWYEVDQAREIIRQNTGVAPDSMAYVGGGFDATLEQIVQQAGYTTARSILRGTLQSQDLRYELRVSRIGGYDDVKSVLTQDLVPGLPTFVKRMSGQDPG